MNYIVTAEERAKLRERIVMLSRMANINHGEEETLAIIDKLPEVEISGCKSTFNGGRSWVFSDVYFEPSEEHRLSTVPLYAIKETK